MTPQIVQPPLSVNLYGSTVTPGTAMILSIWPSGLVSSVPHAGQVTYRLPPAAKNKIRGVTMNPARVSVPWPSEEPDTIEAPEREVPEGQGYSFLVCCDTNQFVREPITQKSQAMPCRAYDAAIGLLHSWGSIVTKFRGGRAGIRVADPNVPIQQQIDEMYRDQTILFRGMMEEADMAWAAKHFDHVTDAHRFGAKWLGEERDWCQHRMIAAQKTCGLCASLIASDALKCPSCQSFLPEDYLKYGIDYASDAAVTAFLSRKSKPAPSSRQ